MHARARRLIRTLPILMALGCGGGSDGGPTDTPVIVLSRPSLDLVEGTPETLTVALDAAPAANVSVTLASGGKVALLPATLTFTPGNFATPKSVIITPLQDSDLVAGVDTVAATAPGLVTVIVPVTIADDDSQAVVLDSTSLSILEGDSATYGVRLAYQPVGMVGVTLSASDTMVVVTPTSLQFTPADYGVRKQVRVRARQDQDVVPDTLHITATIPGGSSTSLPVSITDDDIQAIEVDSPSVAVAEGDSVTVHVRLAFQPAALTNVDIASADSGAAVPLTGTLDFTPANYAVAKSVVIRAVQDSDTVDEAAVVRFHAAGIGHTDVTVNVADDDSQGILTSADSVAITEGDTIQVGVRLAAQPAAGVTVNVSTLFGLVTAAPATLSFTPADYATPKQVTVIGMVDPSANEGTGTVRFSAAGLPDKDVRVHVADNGVQSILSPLSPLQVEEGTSLGLISVSLTHPPVADVVVHVTPLDTTVARTDAAILTFTPADWNLQQNVTVTGVQDADLVLDSTIVRLSSAGLADVDIQVFNHDDDVQSLVTSTDTVFVTEGDSTTLTITLAFQPVASVSASLAIDSTVATVAPVTVGAFTLANWSTGFTVKVHGTEDANTTTDITDLTITAGGVPVKHVVIVVADND